MKRIPFSQVLKNASIDIRREYDRLYGMFCLQKLADGTGNSVTLRDSCAANFIILPFRGTCVSLDDFDDFYGYSFEKIPGQLIGKVYSYFFSSDSEKSEMTTKYIQTHSEYIFEEEEILTTEKQTKLKNNVVFN